ncbi:MAG: hypothetical protein HQK66_03775 [Desulfamplus sp.]|nr:hypothetical protein [Desulfamplus sp.]
MTKNIVEKIDDMVKIETVLVSVSDKSGLGSFIPGLLELNPGLRILSTGGTWSRIREILGERAGESLIQVSDYTGQPETQGGLVKTLDFKIYLGLLTETYNDEHQNDIKRTRALPIDMVVVNLYPFKETISRSDVTCEDARGNIDIGGPAMIRAGAKNFIRVASVADPGDYPSILNEMESGDGALCLATRFKLARKAFEHTALYDRAIRDYLVKMELEEVKACYGLG